MTTLASRVGSHGVQQRLRAANLQAGAFLAQLEDLPIGNVLYTRVLLDDVEAGRQLLDDLAALPRAMDEIYHNFLLRLAADWKQDYRPILATLAVAQEPLTETQLARFTEMRRTDVRDSLKVVQQFLSLGRRNAAPLEPPNRPAHCGIQRRELAAGLLAVFRG